MESERYVPYDIVDLERFGDKISDKIGIDHTVYGIEVASAAGDSCSVRTIPKPEDGGNFSISNSLLVDLLESHIIERKDV